MIIAMDSQGLAYQYDLYMSPVPYWIGVNMAILIY